MGVSRAVCLELGEALDEGWLAVAECACCSSTLRTSSAAEWAHVAWRQAVYAVPRCPQLVESRSVTCLQPGSLLMCPGESNESNVTKNRMQCSSMLHGKSMRLCRSKMAHAAIVPVPRVMRPSGPVPVTDARLILFSLARCLVAGEAKTLYPGGACCLTLATGASSISDGGSGTVCGQAQVAANATQGRVLVSCSFGINRQCCIDWPKRHSQMATQGMPAGGPTPATNVTCCWFHFASKQWTLLLDTILMPMCTDTEDTSACHRPFSRLSKGARAVYRQLLQALWYTFGTGC